MDSFVDWLNDHLKDLDHEIFRDVIKITGETQPMADGQVVVISEISRMALTLIKSNGEKKRIKVIIKLEPPPGPGRDIANNFSAFNTECLMYSDLLKTMKQIIQETDDSTAPWTDCYCTKENKLIFHDLCEDGYRIVPTHIFLDLDHAKLVMKAIGKFHGVSMVMEQKGLLNRVKSNPSLYSVQQPFLMNIFTMSIEGIVEVMKVRWGPEWIDASERLLKFVERTKKEIFTMANSVKGKWDVLTHGDFNLRNMLFHYPPGSTKPDQVKFVDFQMVSYNNLGFDLSTLLYCSMIPQMRDDNMDILLNAYCESIATTCKQLGYKGPVPTSQDVASCIKSLNLLTTNTSLSFIPFFIASEAGDMQEKSNDSLEVLAENENHSDETAKSYFKEMSVQNMNNPKIVAAVQYEIKRCMRDNFI